jgi:LysM repeat protein
MSTNRCTIWLNFNNDKKKYQIPVNPEKIKMKVNGKVTTSDIDKLGTLLHKGRRDAITVSWSSFFPAAYGPYCACTQNNFQTPADMHRWILRLMSAKKPVHLVITGGPFRFNKYAVITSYSPEEDGGDPGTIQYSIELKEYRGVKITKYKKGKAAQSSKTRVTNTVKSKTYTVKKGDCLFNIAKSYYGDGSKQTKIYDANKTAIEKAAKKNGFKGSHKGKRIFAGTKLTIP